MPFQYPSPGPSDTPSYLISPLPWVSSSVIPSGSVWRIDFPYVTSRLAIHLAAGTAATLGIAFTFSGALGTNRYLITSTTNFADSFVEDVRVKTIYLVGASNNVTASVFAGMTLINPNQFPILTGSAYVSASATGTIYGSQQGPVFGYPDFSGLG